RYYYQYREDRLSACPLVIHGLLHVADDIAYCAPSWATWCFGLERMCGFLGSGLKSRSQPWANLRNRVLRRAYLGQLAARYDLADELSAVASTRFLSMVLSPWPDEHHPADPVSALRFPYIAVFTPDNPLREKIASYFCQVIGHSKALVKAKLPVNMPVWGKVRILHGGDSIRSTVSERGKRNASYVRYEVEVKNPAHARDAKIPEWTRQVFYGRLEKILVCRLSGDSIWGVFRNQERLLAVITPCQTRGMDATEVITKYTTYTTQVVTDLQTIGAAVGRIAHRGCWSIIDRSGGLARTVFTDGD
ncbi:hypothetical protein PLICRDRAFT_84231, partial [Plicaturopsis crispa FD-325 SS-3]